MKSKLRMGITRWWRDVKFQAKEFVLKEMKTHHVVIVLVIALIIGVWTTLLTNFDIMPRDNNPEPRIEQKLCAMWIMSDGHHNIPGTPDAIKETRALVGHPDAYVNC